MNYYTQLLSHVANLKTGTQFCLDKTFYAQALPNVILNVSDKRALGKEFKNDVNSNKINVRYNYKYGNCQRCGYKSSSNIINYVKI